MSARNPLVYSVRFISGNIPAPGGGLFYTVPAGYRAVVRDLDVAYQTTGGSTQVEFAIAGVTFFGNAQNSSALWVAVQWRGRQIANAGDQIGVGVSGDSSSVAVSGYLLVLP